MRLCERSEAISLVWSPLPGDCRVASLLAKTVKLELPLFKFIKSAAKQSFWSGVRYQKIAGWPLARCWSSQLLLRLAHEKAPRKLLE
jgi:hypothetical protein